jgi:hypothetical protein
MFAESKSTLLAIEFILFYSTYICGCCKVINAIVIQNHIKCFGIWHSVRITTIYNQHKFWWGFSTNFSIPIQVITLSPFEELNGRTSIN